MQTDGKYEIPHIRNRLVVWFIAILPYLSVLPFHIIIVSNVRFTSMIFIPCRCGALRSPILRQRYILQKYSKRYITAHSVLFLYG